MHIQVKELTKLVALAALPVSSTAALVFFVLLCVGCDAPNHTVVPANSVAIPKPVPYSFAPSGLWNAEGKPNVSFRFSSFDDGEGEGDLTGYEYTYGRTTPVAGYWGNNRVKITTRTGYLSTILRSDNPTSVSFSYIVGWDGEEILLVLDGTQ